jgi:uncharacterized membrane protein
MADQETFPCQICGKEKTRNDLMPASSVRASIASIIAQDYPGWSPDGYICRADLGRFRIAYVRHALESENNECAGLKGTAKNGTLQEGHLPKNDYSEYEQELTFGERVSDRIAGFAGSWAFIAVFAGLIFLWILLNTYLLLSRPFDAYPFILLNLVLSVLTAIQAPIIIMSQNRQETRDRLHADRDYQESVHTELEIHRLHKKIDHLLTIQGQRFLEIQQIQMELLEELAEKKTGTATGVVTGYPVR